jgi:hypothetical protein
VAASPPIASGQEQASVTISGLAPQELDLIISTGPYKSNKLTAADCVRAALGAARRVRRAADEQMVASEDFWGDPDEEGRKERDAEVLVEFTSTMIACLDLVKSADTRAQPAALSTAARKSRHLTALSVRVRLDRAASVVRYRPRAVSRRSRTRRLP